MWSKDTITFILLFSLLCHLTLLTHTIRIIWNVFYLLYNIKKLKYFLSCFLFCIKFLFHAAQLKAQINKFQFVVSHPSHLFQIETSYFYNGQDILLLLHLPMAPADSILCLFQLHPFPLPFTKTHFLLPKSTNPIFALSSGMERLSTEHPCSTSWTATRATPCTSVRSTESLRKTSTPHA